MKIAVYKDNLATGRGADRAVRNFAAGIAERGHAVALMEKAEFSARILGTDGLTAESFDVIVATGSNEIVDLAAAGYFKRTHRAKVVLQLHLAPRGFFKWRHPLRNLRTRRAFNCADAAATVGVWFFQSGHPLPGGCAEPYQKPEAFDSGICAAGVGIPELEGSVAREGHHTVRDDVSGADQAVGACWTH